MGTSSNRPSPPTPNWSIPKAVLGRTDIDDSRQNQELWKAALADRGGALLKELSQPTIAHLCEVAGKIADPLAALSKYEHVVSESGKASLVLDMAKRAFIRSASNQSGSPGFASELFSEVISYYVSRDLPSFIGKEGRIASPMEAIKLKRSLRDKVKTQATAESLKTDLKGWKEYVKNFTDRIVRRGEKL
jgi:hypothetical protein